ASRVRRIPKVRALTRRGYRSGFVLTASVGVALWKVHQNATALAHRRDNLKVGADFARASPHVAQPMTWCRKGLRVKAASVVGDLESQTGAGWDKGDDEA